MPNQTISSGTVSYTDNNALAASNVVISGSASVNFVAGNCIHLQPGFRATAGTAATTFHAWVETAPTADSFSPSDSGGLTQQFTFTGSSPAGYTNLSEMYALFNTAPSGINACYLRYHRASNLLYLADNAGSTWLGSFTPGSAYSAANSQCRIDGIGSSFSAAGNQLSVTVAVTFQTAFAGPKTEFLNIYNNEGLYSTLLPLGTWTVPGGDTTPPVISNLLHSPTSNSATISWTTNEVSDTQIEYGTTPAYGSWTALNPTLVTSHSQTITGLQPGTAYYYRARSRDAALNLGTATGSFTTTSTGVQHVITSSPAGRSLTVGTESCTAAPCTFYWAPGSQHTIATTTPQAGGGGTQYVFSNWSDGGAISHTITASSSPATYTANFTTECNTLQALNNCIASPSNTTCMLVAETYTVAVPILVGRSNVTVMGGGASRSATVLVRGPSNTAEMMKVDAAQPLTGITIQNLTFCGNSSLPYQDPIPGCTSHQIPVCTTCVDLSITDADANHLNNGQFYTDDPFTTPGNYSVTVNNCAFGDAPGHAISLFAQANPDGTAVKKVNDVYIHDSVVNSSAITGIIVGTIFFPDPPVIRYNDPQYCDTTPNFANEVNEAFPRNLRIEWNTFKHNNTGALGLTTARWVCPASVGIGESVLPLR